MSCAERNNCERPDISELVHSLARAILPTMEEGRKFALLGLICYDCACAEREKINFGQLHYFHIFFFPFCTDQWLIGLSFTATIPSVCHRLNDRGPPRSY